LLPDTLLPLVGPQRKLVPAAELYATLQSIAKRFSDFLLCIAATIFGGIRACSKNCDSEYIRAKMAAGVGHSIELYEYVFDFKVCFSISNAMFKIGVSEAKRSGLHMKFSGTWLILSLPWKFICNRFHCAAQKDCPASVHKSASAILTRSCLHKNPHRTAARCVL
jgi:hypothetical protein